MPIINPGNAISQGSIGQVLRNNNTDNPIVYSQDIQGGLTTVNTDAERLSISPRKIQTGMIVYQTSDSRYHRFLGTDGTNPITLQADGTFNYASPPTAPATTLETSWTEIAFNAAEPAILDNGGSASLAPGIMASQIRNLIGEGEEGFLINFQLTVAAGTFNGGSWGGSTGANAGVLTHTAIGANPRVYLNGVLLQPTTDYTVDDMANTITLSQDIRRAIVDTNNWCISVVDAVDSSTAGSLPSLAGSLEYVGPNFVDHTVTTQEISDATAAIVRGTVSTSATPPVQVATYVVEEIGPNIEIRVTPIEGWTVESTDSRTWDRSPDNSYRDSFPLLGSTAVPFRVVQLIDTGLFFDAPNNYGRTKLSNDPVDNATIDGLGYTTTNLLDARYEPIASSTNQLVTQNDLRDTTSLTNYVTNDTLSSTLPVPISKGHAFPTATEDGHLHFLTEDVFAATAATNPMDVSNSATGSGLQARMNVTATDPNTSETIVAGIVEVRADNTPNPNRIVSQAVSGATTYTTSGRNHGYQGFHLSRLVNAGGGVTNAIYVTESRGNNVVLNGEVVQNAIWQNVHIRVQSANQIGAGNFVRSDASYVAIQFNDDTAANVNTLLTADNAIDMMLGFLSDASSLEVGLFNRTNFVSSIATPASYTGGTLMVSRAQADTEVTEYEFIPQNGFSIDNTSNRTFITGNTVTILPNGRVLERIAGAPVSWQVTFARTYRVPQTGVQAAAPEGQYVWFNNNWYQLNSTTAIDLS